MEFTPRQLAAIDIGKAGQDACIVAGPGSGKTLVLVERYYRLVAGAAVDPRRMLAITFTEKAARSMKQRLARSFRDQAERRRQLEQANVSTVHAFCARLLRENSVAAGVDPEFRVLEARQAVIMQRKAANDALDRVFASEPAAMRRLMRGLASPDLAGDIPGVYDAMRAAGLAEDALATFELRGARLEDLRNELRSLADEKNIGWNPSQSARLREVVEAALRIATLPDAPVTEEHFRALEEFPTNLNALKRNTPGYSRLKAIKDDLLPDLRRTFITRYYSPERETLVDVMRCFEQLYSERKRQMGALDYADLEFFAVRLLEDNTGVRDHVKEQFAHVLMDEFQDTNGQQSRLLNLVRGPDRFYAVGDVNQSIYGFRHANPEVFRDYRDGVEREGKYLVELVENWRSRPDILRAVETILAHAQGIEHHRLIAKKDFADKLEPSVEVLAAIADTPEAALDLEARWVARRILELTGSLRLRKGPAGFGDIAMLVRNSEVLPAFTSVFEEAGIPYLLNQGKGFFETREVVDLVHLLRVIANPRDEISLAAVLRSPLVGSSDEALMRLKQHGNLGSALRRIEHLAAGFEPEDRDRLRRFGERLKRWRETRDLVGFDRLLVRAMDETGYGAGPRTRAASNIEKFLAQARGASSRLTLAEFVDELDLMRDADARDVDVPPEDAVNAVRIMTVHAAKGLEFPVVFLAALNKGIQQAVGSLCFSPRLGLGARWRNPAKDEDKGDWFHAAIREETARRDAEEGNRLFYVAMTRAEEHLVFSLASAGPPKNWAALLAGSLGIDVAVPQRKVERIQAPDGESFLLRLFAVNTHPEPLAAAAEDTSPPAVEVLAPLEPRGQHDFAASVTSVSLFAHCPRRYFLERYLGWRRTGRRNLLTDDEDHREDELDASEFGLEVHALLAGKSLENPSSQALKLAETFRSSELGRRAMGASRAEREFDFVMAVEDMVLRGQIDLWFEESGQTILVDYKTDELKARDTAARAEFYGPQLRLYALALERISGRFPDQAVVFFLRPGVAVPVALERSLLEDPETLVREFREAQSSLIFPLHEGEHCTRCPFFRGLCPAGSGVADEIHPAAIDGEDLAGDEAGAG